MTTISSQFSPERGLRAVAGPARTAAAVTELLARPLALAEGPLRAELEALAREPDRDLLREGLFGFASRQEHEGRLELAAEIYQALGANPNSPLPNASRPASLTQRAQARLDALLGHGAAGGRIEFLMRRLSEEATDPAMLAAMGISGGVFRLTRMATLSRLAISPAASVITRGLGARALASLVGFSIEAPLFTTVGRFGHAAMGRDIDWSASAWGRELASSYLVLGGMKLTGWAGASVAESSALRGVSRAVLRPTIQQGSMLGGILLGRRLEEIAGLRARQPGDTLLVDSLAMLLQFHAAGQLSQTAFGPEFSSWEAAVEARLAALGAPRSQDGPRSGLLPSLATASALSFGGDPAPSGFEMGPLMMVQMDPANLPRSAETTPLPGLPKMGVRPSHESGTAERLNREEADRQLRSLLRGSGLRVEDLQEDAYVKRLLTAFGVTSHEFDVNSFRNGFDIARRFPNRVARMGFDIDEVYLHWAFSPADLMAGVMKGGGEAVYRNTDASFLDYKPFETGSGAQMNFFERIWFQGIQRLLPSRFRQHIQFHPGVRAFQLGLRLGQSRNLIMVTTGPSGRILRLANEDPAMRMIYFGKLPNEPVSIAEVRHSFNIYTREDLVLAMRAVTSGEIRYPENAMVESYLAKIREFPARGVKLKHPGISVLLGKRPFDTLIDDSASTFDMLGDVPNFSVLQPPSARPSLTLNFVPVSPQSYLRRMANGYVSELGGVLGAAERPASLKLSSEAAAPQNYVFQGLSLEIPWDKFGAEFVAPNRELRRLGEEIGRSLPSPTPAPSGEIPPLSMTGEQMNRMGDRLFRELELILDHHPGQVSVEVENTHLYQELAQTAPEDFQATIDRYFSPEELNSLPQARIPLAERGAGYFSRIASLIAVKRSVCQILSLDPAEHSREVHFRFGRPVLRGTAAAKLGTNQLMTTLADDGEVGVGVALLEPGMWSSGLVGIGVDITSDRVNYTRPWQHALAASAFKATYPIQGHRGFNHYRSQEVGQRPDGVYVLTGQTLAAAQALRGDNHNSAEPLPVHALHFRIGDATVALVAIPASGRDTSPGEPAGPNQPGSPPAPDGGSSSPAYNLSNPPYQKGAQGRFALPRPAMSVAVLGDVGGQRTLELARQGHYPIHIERDGDMLELAERLTRMELDKENRPEDSGTFILGDWFDTIVNADRVEAFFPLHEGDVPPRDTPHRAKAMDQFLQLGLVSKLAGDGAGFVISEVPKIIDDLAAAVRRDPNLELVLLAHGQKQQPVVGGYGNEPFKGGHSYMTFRRRS